MIVRFTETGAAPILNDRVDVLYNKTEALDNFLPRREIERVQNVLDDTDDIRRQVFSVERFLTNQIRAPKSISRQVELAARMIRISEGRSSTAVIARRAAMSQSALERHFRAAVGTTPKRLSRLARLQNVCRLWDSGKTLTEIAFEAGYSDQPHMVHDFRLFTGKSPENFLRSASPRNLPTFYK